MSQLTYFIPNALDRTLQDPQSRSDNPALAPTGGAPTGPGTTGGPSGAPSITGTTGTTDPNAPAAQGPCASTEIMWMMPMFLVLMYFMMIRPEQKRKKEQANLLSAIKVGESVVMLSGMHGVVSALDEKTVTVRAGDNNMTFDRSAVSRIVRDEPAPEAGK
ncbi:MAG: preprotein translocase subunit YajC [Planctomycetota bacterium]|jgi:preprotein translocase subunit YajC